jgi:hypothetical protein
MLFDRYCTVLYVHYLTRVSVLYNTDYCTECCTTCKKSNTVLVQYTYRTAREYIMYSKYIHAGRDRFLLVRVEYYKQWGKTL